ncbi:MAG: EF-hand domain-containing protein, partial [Planctomycetes bacterium]|nr:EF-hand domain-containing protein [Planctomycetota bacterium]
MRRIFFTSVVVTIVSTVISTSPVRSEDAVEKDAEGFFKKLDQDQDGKLTGKDFDENRKAFFERLVKDGDKNADGELTFEEFQTTNKPEKKPQGTLGMAPKRPGFSGDPAEHFRRLDADQNGKLTKEEMPERMQSRISKIMERMGKTELSQEDFVKIAERMQGKEKNRTNPN